MVEKRVAILTAIWQANRWLFSRLYDRETGGYSRSYMAGKRVAILATIWQAIWQLFSQLYDRQTGGYSRGYMTGNWMTILTYIWQVIGWSRRLSASYTSWIQSLSNFEDFFRGFLGGFCLIDSEMWLFSSISTRLARMLRLTGEHVKTWVLAKSM